MKQTFDRSASSAYCEALRPSHTGASVFASGGIHPTKRAQGRAQHSKTPSKKEHASAIAEEVAEICHAFNTGEAKIGWTRT